MEKVKLCIVAMILAALLFVAPFSAASENVPYVDITTPTDGATVRGTETIRFRAEGKDLHNPQATINGNGKGLEVLLMCTSEEPTDGGIQSMDCQYVWDTESFEGQKVEIVATVNDGTAILSDSIGVYVSGQRV